MSWSNYCEGEIVQGNKSFQLKAVTRIQIPGIGSSALPERFEPMLYIDSGLTLLASVSM